METVRDTEGLGELLQRGGLISNSLAVRKLLPKIAQLVPLDIPVLLKGETGSGKEIFAKVLHENSRRAAQGFLHLECLTLSEEKLAREINRTFGMGLTGGILPCGSGNGLARHLLLPMNLKKCIEVINQCQIRDLDYGVINDHPFFCTCGMGFDAFVSMKFAESGKRGPITYAENILREGLKYKPETYTLEDETGTKQYKAFLISCANASQYGNNAYIAPQASMSDGLMDVVIMEPFDVIEAPQVSFDMFNKTLDKNSKIKSFRCKKLHITRSQPGVIHYDGDPVMTGAEIDVHLEEKGIKMLVNPFANKNDRKPNMIQSAFADFFNDINAVRDDIHKDIQRQSKRVEAISKLVQKKLNL